MSLPWTEAAGHHTDGKLKEDKEEMSHYVKTLIKCTAGIYLVSVTYLRLHCCWYKGGLESRGKDNTKQTNELQLRAL